MKILSIWVDSGAPSTNFDAPRTKRVIRPRPAGRIADPAYRIDRQGLARSNEPSHDDGGALGKIWHPSGLVPTGSGFAMMSCFCDL